MRSILALVLVCMSSHANAGDWYFTTSVGTTFGGNSEYILRSTSGAALSTVEVKQSLRFASEFTLGNMVSDFADIEMNIGYAGFSSNDLSGTDSVISISLTPKFSVFYNDNVNLWVGTGFGLAINSHNTSYVDATGTIASDQTATSFLLSPRIGADIPVGENHFFGLQFSYSTTTYKDLGGTVTSGSTTARIKTDVSRQMWGAMLRYGFTFGAGK